MRLRHSRMKKQVQFARRDGGSFAQLGRTYFDMLLSVLHSDSKSDTMTV